MLLTERVMSFLYCNYYLEGNLCCRAVLFSTDDTFQWERQS